MLRQDLLICMCVFTTSAGCVTTDAMMPATTPLPKFTSGMHEVEVTSEPTQEEYGDGTLTLHFYKLLYCVSPGGSSFLVWL